MTAAQDPAGVPAQVPPEPDPELPAAPDSAPEPAAPEPDEPFDLLGVGIGPFNLSLAARIGRHPGLTLYAPPVISTVLFRPTDAADEQVAELRRRLMYEGRAVLGRASAGGRLWLKATLLNPYLRPEELDALLQFTAPDTEGTTAP